MRYYSFLEDDDIICEDDEVRLKDEINQDYYGPPGRRHSGWEKASYFFPAWVGKSLEDYMANGDDIEVRRRINIDKVLGLVADLSEADCAYGDNCPKFVKLNHYRCESCKAREAMGYSNIYLKGGFKNG